MPVTVREAVSGDLETLKEFEQEVIRFERPFALNLREDPITYYDFDRLMEREDAILMVATVDDKLVGSGYARVEENVPHMKPRLYAYLGFMYVRPEYSGKGIKGKILDNLINWAEDREIYEFKLDVYVENENAIKAYLKRKFKPNLLEMRMNLYSE